ncbi:hypothetical protein SG34_027860 [Thalassomonas viridans]|uniref:Uncharacterized protein n=1 Tax=Thalassomonas viridans TaxID=137584 RepID=A0AAE9Z4N8_9GAMM|nr:hypothetical protein [Thalassomonas viridans]WDE05072.1 hypothetical protein SG34_027860 [Thalassomonas viridans]
MKKYIKPLLYSVLVITLCLVSLIFFLYQNVEVNSELPLKPDNIPESALWIGGPDGGVYVLVSKDENDNQTLYDAKIYYSEGSVNYIGKLVINTPNNPLFDYRNINSYSGWDGDTLYLQDGRLLTIHKNLLNQ